MGSGPLSRLPWRLGIIPSCPRNLPHSLQAVLQMEQRKQQQQGQNSPAPGPEGQLQFHPDTGALGTPGAGRVLAATPGPREEEAGMPTATIASLHFQMMHLSQLQWVTRRMATL